MVSTITRVWGRAAEISRVASTPRPVVTSQAATAPVPVRLRVRVLGDSTANAIGWMLKSVAAPDVAVELRAKDGLNLIYADHIRWNGNDEGVGVTLVSVGGSFLYGIHVGSKWTLACHARWNSLFEEGLDLHLRDLAGSKSQLWLATAPYPVGPYDYEARRKQVDCINRSLRKVAQKHPRFRLLDLAEEGYLVLCADVYGKGVRPTTNQEASQEAGKLKGDRALARARANAALEFLRKDPRVDVHHVSAIGFCLGGLVALELARSGAVDVSRSVTRRYALEQAAEAYDALNRGEIVGRAIITMR